MLNAPAGTPDIPPQHSEEPAKASHALPGLNQLVLNRATMNRVVEAYLNKHLIGAAVRVASVTFESNDGGGFKVMIQPAD